MEKAEGTSPGFVTAFMDVTHQLDSNDLDFSDLLVLVAAEVQRKLKQVQIPGFSDTSTYLQRLWDDLVTLLHGKVELRKAEVDVPFGSLARGIAAIVPEAVRSSAKEIEELATELIAAVNQLLVEANAAIRKTGRAGLLLIIDGLDKISRRPLPNGSNTHDRLFIDRSEHLAALKTHVVYTVPIFHVLFAPPCAVLEQTFGVFNKPVSMIPGFRTITLRSHLPRRLACRNSGKCSTCAVGTRVLTLAKCFRRGACGNISAS